MRVIVKRSFMHVSGSVRITCRSVNHDRWRGERNDENRYFVRTLGTNGSFARYLGARAASARLAASLAVTPKFPRGTVPNAPPAGERWRRV
jgi:hypothetical protein